MTEIKNDYPFDAVLPDQEVTYTTDSKGNIFGWVDLKSAADLEPLGSELARNGARLCTITAYKEDKFAKSGNMEVVYNFDFDGPVLTVSLHVTPECRTIPSLINHFANADWHEREFAELYDIELSGRESPERLFLDPSIDKGVLNRLIPLSSMMNGASTKQLWEKIFSETSMPEWAEKD